MDFVNHHVILSLWQDRQQDADNVTWSRDFYAAMRSWSAGSVYVNALSEDDQSRISEAFGPNLDRLREVKKKFDPENRFRRNQNITPEASDVQETTRLDGEAARAL